MENSILDNKDVSKDVYVLVPQDIQALAVLILHNLELDLAPDIKPLALEGDSAVVESVTKTLQEIFNKETGIKEIGACFCPCKMCGMGNHGNA